MVRMEPRNVALLGKRRYVCGSFGRMKIIWRHVGDIWLSTAGK